MKCECPGNPVHSGKYEAHSGSLQCKDKESNGFPEGLLTNSVAAEVAVVFTPKEGEGSSLWHGGGVEMLKSVCNQRVQRPDECWGMVCCSLCSG